MHCVYYPPEVGGLESHVHYLCREFVRRGHRVDVVTSRSRPELESYEVRDGVHVWRSWLPGRTPAGWLAHAVSSLPNTFTRSGPADVLHAQAFQSIPPLATARLRTGAPLIATWHTSHFLKLAEKPGWRTILRRLVDLPDANLAASEEIAGVAERLAPGSHVEALTNGVDTEFFAPSTPSLPPASAGRKRLIVPRRLFEKNGVEYFIRGMPALLAEVDVEAVIVGDGPERAELERLSSELGVSDRVDFLGAQPHDEMVGLLSSADAAVFPSLMEATSVAALECMACEIPVAASRVGGLPEIVDESVGTLFEPADPEDLAKKVAGMLQRSNLRDAGARARERVVAHWSNARLADRHLALYEELLKHRAA